MTSDERHYAFESANMGTVEVDVTGEWRDGTKDVGVTVGAIGTSRDFEGADGGTADEIFEWLMGEGVEFESDASLWFNVNYVGSVMLDGDATATGLLARLDGMTAAQLAEWREATF